MIFIYCFFICIKKNLNVRNTCIQAYYLTYFSRNKKEIFLRLQLTMENKIKNINKKIKEDSASAHPHNQKLCCRDSHKGEFRQVHSTLYFVKHKACSLDHQPPHWSRSSASQVSMIGTEVLKKYIIIIITQRKFFIKTLFNFVNQHIYIYIYISKWVKVFFTKDQLVPPSSLSCSFKYIKHLDDGSKKLFDQKNDDNLFFSLNYKTNNK